MKNAWCVGKFSGRDITRGDTNAGFGCIAAYFIKSLIKIKIFESPLVKLELAQ
jgi:hypothetical protein